MIVKKIPLVALISISLIAAEWFLPDRCPRAMAWQDDANITVVGFSVTLPDRDSEYGESAVPGRSAGTEVYLRCRDSKKYFIGLAEIKDEQDSSLDLLDENGKKLSNEENYSSFGFGTDISDDGHQVTIPVSVTGLPPNGCTKLQVKGTLELLTGKNETTDDTTFEVKQGVATRLGNVEVKLAEVEENPYGEPGWMISFESRVSLDALAEVVFMDGDGNELESMSAGGGSFGFDDDMTWSKNYVIQGGQPTSLTARVRYFKSTENVSIPVDVKVTLGLRAR